MKKTNIAITGCIGRMGQQIIKSVRNDKSFKLVSLTESKIIKKRINGIKIDLNTDQAFKKADVIIDFTIPKCTLQVLKIASRLKKRVVIGTTGFTKKEENLIKKFSKNIPILKAGNMSLGINLLMYLTEIASSSLGRKFLSKVFEVHHRHKKDYPSGTALMLGEGIAKGKNLEAQVIANWLAMIFRKSGKRVGIGVEPNGNEPTSIFGKTLVRCFELFDVKGQSQSGRPDWRRYAENAVKVKMYT